MGCIGRCPSDNIQRGLLRCLHHTICQELGVGRWNAATQKCGVTDGRLSVPQHPAQYALSRTRPVPGLGFIFPLWEEGVIISALWPRLGLCRSLLFRMSQSRETPKRKSLTERTDPRYDKEEKPLRPCITAVLTPKAVASDAACRGVQLNAVVKRRYRNSLPKTEGID